MARRKYSLENILGYLTKFGLDPSEQEEILKEVNEVTEARILARIANQLPAETLGVLQKLNKEKIERYIKDNQNRLPKLTDGDIHTIENQVWDEYFQKFKVPK